MFFFWFNSFDKLCVKLIPTCESGSANASEISAVGTSDRRRAGGGKHAAGAVVAIV